MADEQAALLAQIKALSGAIDQRRSAPSQTGGRGAYRARGRGRGGYGGAVNGASNGAPLPSRHRSLVITPTSNGGTVSTSASSDQRSAAADAPEGSEQDGWVKRKSTHNMSLVSSKTFEKTEPARLAAMAATQSAKQASRAGQAGPSSSSSTAAAAKRNAKGSASVRRGDNMGEVIIDGVTFEFDASGTKLVKKAVQASDPAEEETKVEEGDAAEGEGSSTGSTPLRTSVNGQAFIRTKTGNMISQALLDQRRENKRNSAKLKRLETIGKEIANRQAIRNAGRASRAQAAAARKKTLCAYYNKTGQCKNGLSCPYKHDLSRIAICPRFLGRNGCPLPAGTCPLSHDPKPERVPHCVHFLANAGACRNGEACTYTHPAADVQLTNASPICMAFSDLGWCAKGRSCPQRHTWDCPEFLRKGKCERRGCKLMHVVRAPVGDGVGGASKGAEQLDDDDLFTRDDDAGVHPSGDEEETEEQERPAKRKRGQPRIHEVELDGDASDDEEGEEPIRFKAHKTKAFSGQDDFISFNDMDEEEEDEEVDDEGVDEGEDEEHVADEIHSASAGKDVNDDDEDAASVHSNSPSAEGSDED